MVLGNHDGKRLWLLDLFANAFKVNGGGCHARFGLQISPHLNT